MVVLEAHLHLLLETIEETSMVLLVCQFVALQRLANLSLYCVAFGCKPKWVEGRGNIGCPLGYHQGSAVLQLKRI